jgi:hypothetical protein
MAINQRLINVDFNSYRLGRFLSPDPEHSANFASAPLRAIRVDDAAAASAYGLPAGALVPLAAQAPALRRNRLAAVRTDSNTAASASSSSSSSSSSPTLSNQFYCVDADGVRSIPSGQNVLAFDASSANFHSGIAMVAAQDSQFLVH